MGTKCTKVPPRCPRYKGGNCTAYKQCEYQDTYTNAAHIRAMSDEELAQLLCTADWCEVCNQVKEDGTCHAIELGGPLNPYCEAAALKWLRLPEEENQT